MEGKHPHLVNWQIIREVPPQRQTATKGEIDSLFVVRLFFKKRRGWLTDSNCTELPCKHFFFSPAFWRVEAQKEVLFEVSKQTHRPGKAEGQNYPGFVIPLERKGIPSEDRRRSHSETAGPRSRDPRLVFLQANFKKGIALVPCAFSIRRAPCAITTRAAQQLPVHIVHR